MAPAYARVAAEMEPRMRFLKVDTEAEDHAYDGFTYLLVSRTPRPGSAGCA